MLQVNFEVSGVDLGGVVEESDGSNLVGREHALLGE